MGKFRVNLDRPKVSSEEIKAKQNFDQIIKNYHVTPKSFFQKGWFWGTVGLATVAAVTVFTFTSLNSKEVIESKEKQPTAQNASEMPPDTPCIKPPKEGAQPNYQIFEIDPKKENTIETKEGSVITIPAHSFTDKNGQLIVTPIEIKIREFYDKEEVFISGIPMHYDSAGTKYSLETAGMIEIRGTYNGEELNKTDKSFEVQLKTNNTDENFNLYALKENENRWDYIQPLHSEQLNLESLEKPEVYEAKSKELKTLISKTKSEINELERSKPVEPRKLNESKFSFDIDANKSQFPELAHFKNVIFEVGEENKGFTEEVYATTWEDLKLIRIGEKYQVVLTKGAKQEKYFVYPALTGNEYSKAKSNFDQKFKLYHQNRDSKEKELENFEEEYKLNKKKWEQAVAYSKKMEFQHNERNGKYANASGVSIHKSQDKVMRVFEASEFGVFNCDRKIKYPSAQKVLARFERQDGSRIQNLHNVHLITDKRNSVFKYDKSELAQFGFNPKHENRIWMIDEKGAIYACGNDEFDKIDKNAGSHVFVMKRVPEFKSVEEFKMLTQSMQIES